MDVGLNNRNTLGEIAPEFKDVVFFVEANSNEQFEIWEDWSRESMSNIEPLDKEVIDSLSEAVKSWPVLNKIVNINNKLKNNYHKRVEWEQIMAGFMLTIGSIKKGKEKFPISVSFSFATIEGKKICFYYCCSAIADYPMVEEWLIKRFQLTHDNYTRWNHTDANNFHNCINSLDNLDEKPRNTKYKKSR